MGDYAIVKPLTDMGGNAPPSVPLQGRTNVSGKGNPIHVRAPWWRYIQEYSTAAEYKYARSVGKWWINRNYQQGKAYSTALAESIICPFNFVEFSGYQDGCGIVRAFSANENPFDNFFPGLMNWHNYPHLFQKIVSYKGGQIGRVGSGWDVFVPLLQENPLYLPLGRVEMFPTLPFHGMVTDIFGLNVRMDADGTWVDKLEAFVSFDVLEYRLRGASVWGRIGDERWICLRLSEALGQCAEYTTWHLQTPGVWG